MWKLCLIFLLRYNPNCVPVLFWFSYLYKHPLWYFVLLFFKTFAYVIVNTFMVLMHHFLHIIIFVVTWSNFIVFISNILYGTVNDALNVISFSSKVRTIDKNTVIIIIITKKLQLMKVPYLCTFSNCNFIVRAGCYDCMVTNM